MLPLAVAVVWGGCAKVQTGVGPGGSGGAGSSPADGSTSLPDLGSGRGEVGTLPPPIDGSDDSVNCSQSLRAVIRDFKGQVTTAGEIKHPDFEYVVGPDLGIVAEQLGSDDKPVYAHPGGMTKTTNGADAFNQWYRDVAGVNIRFEKEIPLTPDPARPGTFIYDNAAFFPIDDVRTSTGDLIMMTGFGDQYQGHNYDFTSEFHFNFPYRGGEKFTFRGDDDVWLFVNGHLAIDLGGVHDPLTGTVDLDARAAEFGLVKNNFYRMDIFQAERHVTGSNFHIETTLQCIDNVVIP